MHCILLLPSVGTAYASGLCVVALFHLTSLTRPQLSVPAAAKMYDATMHPHASTPSWFVLRYPSWPLYAPPKLVFGNLNGMGTLRRTSSALARRPAVLEVVYRGRHTVSQEVCLRRPLLVKA